MTTAGKFAVALIALLHVYIMILEMFLWTRPAGMRAFGTKPEFAEASKVLAANQGLYNGFLAAGLFWGLFTNNRNFKIFFLLCVIAAGVFGGLTVKTSILFTQALPALLALIFVILSRANSGGIRSMDYHS